jgi:hypothetical protein
LRTFEHGHSGIDKLPPETLQKIFGHAIEESELVVPYFCDEQLPCYHDVPQPRNATALLLVSRKWYANASAVFFKHLKLDFPTYECLRSVRNSRDMYSTSVFLGSPNESRFNQIRHVTFLPEILIAFVLWSEIATLLPGLELLHITPIRNVAFSSSLLAFTHQSGDYLENCGNLVQRLQQQGLATNIPLPEFVDRRTDPYNYRNGRDYISKLSSYSRNYARALATIVGLHLPMPLPVELGLNHVPRHHPDWRYPETQPLGQLRDLQPLREIMANATTGIQNLRVKVTVEHERKDGTANRRIVRYEVCDPLSTPT